MLGFIFTLVGITLVVWALIWHSGSNPKAWSAGMIALLTGGILSIIIGIILLIAALVKSYKLDVFEATENPPLIIESEEVVSIPEPVITQRTPKVYDPVLGRNISIDLLRKRCDKFSLDNLLIASKFPVYQEHCFDILKDKFAAVV